jgi:hypothetical protein
MPSRSVESFRAGHSTRLALLRTSLICHPKPVRRGQLLKQELVQFD